jgi:uncharacterized protein (UPF0276 family)
MASYPVSGVGLGYRREMSREFRAQPPALVDFLEVAPENWIGVGGAHGRQFAELCERYPMVFHGLSLSIGGPDAVDMELVRAIGRLMRTHKVRCYTEHLSYCAAEGHLYDLMPIPFSADAVRHVVSRVRQVQDALGQRIALENVSYYAAAGGELSELEFIQAVLEEADCGLLLDVNNVYVNSINHNYDPDAFMLALPPERIMYLHVAGHLEEAPDLRVDTHGHDVIDPVWKLLSTAYRHFGVMPTLLERDFNIPPLAVLRNEVEQISIRQRSSAQSGTSHVQSA